MRYDINTSKKSEVTLSNQKKLNYDMRIFLSSDGQPGAFGLGIAELMRGVSKNGSLSKAAEEMGMAYSKAWKILRRIESYLGFQLIFRQVGRGCGSSLTEKGVDLLHRYDAFLAEMNESAEASFHRHFDGL